MADFTELTLDTGYGDYHFNRYRIAFQPLGKKTAAFLASDLTVRFPTYFNSSFAITEWGDHYHEAQPTLHFHGFAKVLGIDLGAPHTDWVARFWMDQMVGFTVQTLKREFISAGEDIAAFVPGVVAGAYNPIVGGIASYGGVHYNRMHFLAGRRSWRIGPGSVFGVPGNVVVMETIAVERFSSKVFMVPDFVLGLESKIPDIWIALLNNFVTMNGATVVPQTPGPRWKSKNRVDYVTLSFGSLAALKADPEFAAAFPLYPTILPP
jgi:hypothetical protein